MTRITKFKLTVFGYRVGEIIQAISIILVWQANTLTKPTSEINGIMTYFIIGYLFMVVTRTYISNSLPSLIASGKLVQYQMYPQSMFSILLTRGIGNSIMTNLLSILTTPIFIVPFWHYVLPVSNGLTSILVLIFFLVFSLWMKYMWEIIVSCIAFITPEFQGIINSSDIVWQVLAGSLIPFYLLNPNLQFLQYFAPSFTFYHPMQIYLGKYDTNQTILVFLGGLTWCLVLYILAKIVFKLGLKRNESVGL
jgi:ABC-2 type transport system permease protein